MEEKIVFKKKVILPISHNERYPRIRVERETYEEIVKLSLVTGHTQNDITTELLNFALKHVEVSDEIEIFDKGV
ncbi:hypothetical protein [Hoylesella nanceiensis]|jgi:hypothetical protein|uniref:hypothetical protein n=1 Tax=Hoylesella nanceiensis TaxID=425941 RepID=UPI0006603BF7|nr:hypothetical protein [Hoylesella nanceiensis]MBF1438653.1 hypothetical protein [Hoylesella nanceiensis]